MLSMVLFVSGGEIMVILLAILVFFGADKIPEFARMMGKGVREFKKATDDIKREFNESSSGILDDVKSIRDDLTNTVTREISEPLQETATETAKSFEEYKDQYNVDYYYNNPDYIGSRGNEYTAETHAAETTDSLAENTADAPDTPPTDVAPTTEPANEPVKTVNE